MTASREAVTMITDHDRAIILEKLAEARLQRDALDAAGGHGRRQAERRVRYWLARLEEPTPSGIESRTPGLDHATRR